jgi:hypothetical protein
MPQIKKKKQNKVSTKKRTKGTLNRSVEPSRGSSAWLGGIPQGTHGSTIIQRKLWKVTSDFKRISDWYDFGGKCISCNCRVEHWSVLQGGHYRAWSICRGYSKFSFENIFGQCAFCNSAGGRINKDTHSVGHNFGMGIVERYGLDRLMELENYESKPTAKMDDFIMVEMIKDIIIKMDVLPEKPSYYQNARRKIKEMSEVQ